MKKAIVYTVAFLAVQVLMPVLIQQSLRLLTGSEPVLNAKFLIISSTACSVAAMAVFLGLRWAVVSRSYVRSKPWFELTWCGMAAIGVIIPSAWMQELLPELPNVAEQQFDLILRDRWGYFVVGLLAPVCEELVFRGAVLRALLGWARHHWVAIGVSALLFAVAHANPAQMPHAFAVGLLLGWFYYRTHSVVPGVVFHWVNNSAAYVIYNFYPDPQIQLIDVFGNHKTVAAAIAFSLFILLPSIFELYVMLRRADQTR